MPVIGEQLAGRYRIDGQLGTGGMASVYRGHDLRLGRDVAIKVLLPHVTGDPTIAERFDREGRSLAALSHPNVVAVFDVEPGDLAAGLEPFFVMELCAGGSLADRMAAAGGRIAPDELVPIVADVSEGLAAVHQAGLLHRDVKPHNVLIADGRAKLGDLGLARPEEEVARTSLTAAGTALGTLAYLAPERLAGVPANAAADVWSLGALVFQGLTGRLPRPATTVAELVERRFDMPPLVSAMAPDLERAFDESVAAALDPEPSSRPSPLAFSSGLVADLGRWSREGGPARWTNAIPATEAENPSRDIGRDGSAMTTSVAIPVAPQEPRVGQTSEMRDRNARSRSRAYFWLVIVGALAIAFAGLLAFAGFGGGRPSSASPSLRPTATPSASALSSSPSPSTRSSQTPKPTADAFAPAQARLANLRTAIAAASGGHGIKGRVAKDLNDLLAQEQRILDSHDAVGARTTADQLVQAINHIKKDQIDKKQTQALIDAAEALQHAVARL